MNDSVISTESRIKVCEIIYYIYFLILFGARAVGLYEGQTVYNITLILGATVFIIKTAATKHTVSEYLAGLLILGTGGLTYLCSGEKGLLLYFTMMLGMKGVKEKKVIKLGLYILGISYFVLYLLSVTGIITELNHINKRGGYGFLLRHSLGYPYPNTAHTTFLILVILFFYLYEAKSFVNLIRASVIAMLANLYIYLYTVSLTGLISVTLYLVINIYLQKRQTLAKAEGIVISLFLPLVLLFSITGPLLATGSVFTFMNTLLHKRYEYALYFLTNEKITLFGSYFKQTPTNWYMLDNSFLYLFLQLGVIPFVLVSALYILWIRSLIKENRLRELAIMITFCFIGMSDPFLFNLSFKNITFIFLGEWFYTSLADITAKLPAFFGKEIILLPFGEKTFTPDNGSCPVKNPVFSETFYELGSHIVKYALIFAVAGLLFSGAYTGLTKEPRVLYVDSAIADPYFSHKNIEMTPEDVEAALAEGNLVEGYDEDDPTMYVFKKSAPHMEYIRSALTCGVIAGLISILVVAFIKSRRKR